MNPLLEARRLLGQMGLSGRRFNGDLLLERLESRLGIAVDAIPNPRLPAGGISGARITTNGSHVVFYPARASRYQQLAVICHECAHLILNHRDRSAVDLLSGIDPPSPEDELAAEALGAALVHLARRPDRLRRLMPVTRNDGQHAAATTLRSQLRSFYGLPGRAG